MSEMQWNSRPEKEYDDQGMEFSSTPAFPVEKKHIFNPQYNGMSKRAFAAIELSIPDSGEEWLDEMIRKSNRRKAACTAMQGILASWSSPISFSNMAKKEPLEQLTKTAYAFADELLKQETDEIN